MKLLDHKHKWQVMRTIWPYNDGYGVVCKGCTVLEHGLSKKEAQKIVSEMQ